MDRIFTIGKLAKASGVSVETIRFYEREGILRQPERRQSFRNYPFEYIHHIRFIKRSQELGFTLVESKELLALHQQGQTLCEDILDKTDLKISEINAKIEDLKKMKGVLENLVNCCEDRRIPLSDCTLLDQFMGGKS